MLRLFRSLPDRVVLAAVVLCGAFGFGMSGCASTTAGDLSTAFATHPVATSCAGAGDAFAVVGQNANFLSPIQRASLVRLMGVINPVCMAKSEPTLTSAEQTAFDAAIAELANMATTVKATQ
jgi:hypothetical protein